jgi:LmbE family N-acetylglucosaminyl deacetylase
MKNILAIGAHPDDVEFGCFGTLKKHILNGDSVTICLMSASDVNDATTGLATRTKVDSINEASLSSQLIGAKLITMDFEDTKIPFNHNSIRQLEKIINDNNIDTIYTHWPGDTHQDHINTLNTTLAAARLVNNVFCYEQVPLPRVCINYPVANYFVDITNTMNCKIDACELHTSQVKKYKLYNIDIIDNLKTLAMYRGNQCSVKYAEAFNILKMISL